MSILFHSYHTPSQVPRVFSGMSKIIVIRRKPSPQKHFWASLTSLVSEHSDFPVCIFRIIALVMINTAICSNDSTSSTPLARRSAVPSASPSLLELLSAGMDIASCQNSFPNHDRTHEERRSYLVAIIDSALRIVDEDDEETEDDDTFNEKFWQSQQRQWAILPTWRKPKDSYLAKWKDAMVPFFGVSNFSFV